VDRRMPVTGHGLSTAPLAYPTNFCLLDTHSETIKSDGHPRRVRYQQRQWREQGWVPR
jgi:hypothetical protein